MKIIKIKKCLHCPYVVRVVQPAGCGRYYCPEIREYFDNANEIHPECILNDQEGDVSLNYAYRIGWRDCKSALEPIINQAYDLSAYAAASQPKNTDEFLYDDGGLFDQIGSFQKLVREFKDGLFRPPSKIDFPRIGISGEGDKNEKA